MYFLKEEKPITKQLIQKRKKKIFCVLPLGIYSHLKQILNKIYYDTSNDCHEKTTTTKKEKKWRL